MADTRDFLYVAT